jgi:hypothetical protein
MADHVAARPIVRRILRQATAEVIRVPRVVADTIQAEAEAEVVRAVAVGDTPPVVVADTPAAEDTLVADVARDW